MEPFAIVTVGYNRPACMQRLLASLDAAHYPQDIPLIVSLDNCGNDAVEQAVKAFTWHHGEKKILTHPERLGLKKHILSCGELTKQYENIIVFEDDLYVSPYWFDFVTAAVERYGSDERIAGIGLYNYDFCQNSGYPFSPIADGNDVFFIRHACSWGQVWSSDKWAAFRKWYESNSAPFDNAPEVPANVNRWNEKSWLKYHVRYCIDTDKYFVFPRESLTTNFSTAGSHSKRNSNLYQVPLLSGKRSYALPTLDESGAVYDAFFENTRLADHLGVKADELCVDLYGVRENSAGKKYWLTERDADYAVVRSFGLEFKPRDANILYDIEGDVFRLYDTTSPAKNTPRSAKTLNDLEVEYAARDISLKKMIHFCMTESIRRAKKKR